MLELLKALKLGRVIRMLKIAKNHPGATMLAEAIAVWDPAHRVVFVATSELCENTPCGYSRYPGR